MPAREPAPSLPGGHAGTTTAPQPITPGPGAVRPDQPGAMTPQAPKRPIKVVEKTKPTRRLQPGDLVCGQCGEGNAPVRKFCSRCGNSLAEAAVVKKKWWRKLIPKRKAKVLEAGQRPGRDGVAKKRKLSLQPIIAKLRLVIGGLILLGGIVYALHPPFRTYTNDKAIAAKDFVLDPFIDSFEPIRPTGVAAIPPQPNPDDPERDLAELVIDLGSNTTWTFAPPDPNGLPPTITVSFDRRVNLDRLKVINGASDGFAGFHRVREVKFVFSNNQTFETTFDDTPDPQDVSIENGQDITSVEIQIVSIYPSTQGTQGALTEVEFFQGE
ncbi:MAG: zinc ribbon domain-containing protein [Acidimicrobiales bacterium]